MKSPFDIVTDLTQKTYDAESYSSNAFMVDVILSLDEKIIGIVDEANRLSHVDPRMRYDFYFYMLPKGRRFQKYYLEKKKTKMSEEDEQILQISKELKVNRIRATEYFKILKSKNAI